MKVISYGRFLFDFDQEGNPVKSIECDLSVDGPFDLGLNREGYLITNPQGATFVVDATTSLIAGRTLEQVRNEFNHAGQELVERRLDTMESYPR